jgi:hypothetical protein
MVVTLLVLMFALLVARDYFIHKREARRLELKSAMRETRESACVPCKLE